MQERLKVILEESKAQLETGKVVFPDMDMVDFDE